ncbi:hypothetical protein Arth_4399 (plasmid) [Arthrobacter sp. FB24]|nr:hypothetical protein Arth_4399 [Arthrobacter sp. FB24]
MAQGDIETYEDGQWKNKREGSDLAFDAGYSTKEDAVAAGREAARADKVEHIIKNQDGVISEKNSYGNDPRNVPGLTGVSRQPRPGNTRGRVSNPTGHLGTGR